MPRTYEYYTPLVDCLNSIVQDLTEGLESEFVGKSTGAKVNG